MTPALNDKNSKNNNDSGRGYGRDILLKVSLPKEYSPECEELDHQDEFYHQIIWGK